MLIPGYKMQYMGQLNDLEIVSPVTSAATADDWQQIIESFETTYGRVYASSARSPELGFSVTGAILRGMVVTQKPVLPEDADAGPTPPRKPISAPGRSTAIKSGWKRRCGRWNR
jgi:acetone carboxylase beta subunit